MLFRSLSNVDNTSDVNKPISTAVQTALDAKQNKIYLQAPIMWKFNVLQPNDPPLVALDLAGNYTMGSLVVSNNTNVFGDLNVGSSTNIKNFVLNGFSFNPSTYLTGSNPSGGISLVSTTAGNNIIKGIIAQSPITISESLNNIL